MPEKRAARGPPPEPRAVAGVGDALDLLESRRHKGAPKKRRSDLDLDSIR